MKNSNTIGYVLVFNTILFFSTFEVVSRTITHVYSSWQINVFRFFIGGIVLLLTLLFSSSYKISIKNMMTAALLGVLNIGISMNLLQLSLSLDGASAALSAVLFSTNPVFVVFFAGISGKEKIQKKTIFSLLICVAGILIIFYERLISSHITIVPALLALLSSLVFGLYTVLAGSTTKKIGSRKMNAYSFLFGSLFAGIPMIFIDKNFLPIDISGIVQILYLGIAVSGIAYLTYFKGLSIIGAGKGSMVFFLKPVIASFLAFIFLHESISQQFIIGTLCIMAGIFISLNFKLFNKQ